MLTLSNDLFVLFGSSAVAGASVRILVLVLGALVDDLDQVVVDQDAAGHGTGALAMILARGEDREYTATLGKTDALGMCLVCPDDITQIILGQEVINGTAAEADSSTTTGRLTKAVVAKLYISLVSCRI